MDIPYRSLLIGLFVLFFNYSNSAALISTNDINHPKPKAISDFKETILKTLGFQMEDVKIHGFNTREVLVGHSVAYEFVIEIGNMVLPLKLLEDVNRWEYVDLPIFWAKDSLSSNEDGALVENYKTDKEIPVLAPFQLAGPMEFWVQDANDMKLSLPHDVDAGVLKKVVLADGAVVSVKGARSVNLRHPLDFPLPLNTSQNGFPSGLLTLAERLRQASLKQAAHPLSLRIVGPTSITTTSSPNRLKLKRLGPGLVELSSPYNARPVDSLSTIDLHPLEHASVMTLPFTSLWPLSSVNSSNSNLRSFESILSSIMGHKTGKEGSFKLLKADVSAQTFVKIGFGIDRKVKESEIIGFPNWRTKPNTIRMDFEVVGKVDGDKVILERIVQVNPVMIEDTVAPSVISGNMTLSTSPIVYPPQNPFTL